MDYLKKYNLTDEQINNIRNVILERNIDIDIFEYNEEEIMSMLDLFTSIGVTNIYGIMIENPDLFRDTYSSIERRINAYPDKSELARLLNENAENLKLIGML